MLVFLSKEIVIPNTIEDFRLPESQLGTPVDWNIVIVGAWNVAILTPSGVASRLFGLPPGTPIEILVDVEGRAPIRVKHDGITIEPSQTSLVITPQVSNPELLEKSVGIAKRALEILPETPFSAIGLNFRFKFDVIPDSLIEAGVSIIDNKLSDKDYQIHDKILKRQIAWNDGFLNLDIHERKDSSALILFNYHQNSISPAKLSEWLEYHEKMLYDSKEIIQILINE